MNRAIGILGDIGSGKSFVAKQFGYPVFNADKEVANIYKKSNRAKNYRDFFSGFFVIKSWNNILDTRVRS